MIAGESDGHLQGTSAGACGGTSLLNDHRLSLLAAHAVPALSKLLQGAGFEILGQQETSQIANQIRLTQVIFSGTTKGAL
jgi:hypothetical protein